MKIENKLIVISQGVTTDANDHLNSIFKIINGLKLAIDSDAFKSATGFELGKNEFNFPIQHTLSSMWQFDKKTTKPMTLEAEMKLLGPDGNQSGTTYNLPVEVEAKMDNMWVHANINAITLNKAGYYQYIVVIKSENIEIGRADYKFSIEISNDKSLMPL